MLSLSSRFSNTEGINLRGGGLLGWEEKRRRGVEEKEREEEGLERYLDMSTESKYKILSSEFGDEGSSVRLDGAGRFRP